MSEVPRILSTPVLRTEWCNIFGDDINGAKRVLGGLSEVLPEYEGRRVTQQWYCPTPSVGHFRFVCAHGHAGQVMYLCQKHYDRYKDSVTFCPRCNIPPSDHKCQLKLEHAS